MTTELDTLLKFGAVATPDEILAGTETNAAHTPASILAEAEERNGGQRGYAGVSIWVGDAQVTQLVSEVAIQNEQVPGTALKWAASRCFAIYDNARGTQNDAD